MGGTIGGYYWFLEFVGGNKYAGSSKTRNTLSVKVFLWLAMQISSA